MRTGITSRRAAVAAVLLVALALSLTGGPTRSDSPHAIREHDGGTGNGEHAESAEEDRRREEYARSLGEYRRSRIERGRAELRDEARKRPNTVEEALVSLVRPESIETFVPQLVNQEFDVLEFYHVDIVEDQVFVGGFVVEDTPARAMDDYLRAQREMLLEGTRNLSGLTMTDEDVAAASARAVAVMEQRLSRLELNGIALAGVRIRGGVGELQQLSEDSRVLVIEIVKSSERPEPIWPVVETS